MCPARLLVGENLPDVILDALFDRSEIWVLAVEWASGRSRQEQILVLGLTFMSLGVLSDGMFALIAGSAGNFLRRSRRFLHFQRWFAGTSFIGLGITAALVTRK